MQFYNLLALICPSCPHCFDEYLMCGQQSLPLSHPRGIILSVLGFVSVLSFEFCLTDFEMYFLRFLRSICRSIVNILAGVIQSASFPPFFLSIPTFPLCHNRPTILIHTWYLVCTNAFWARKLNKFTTTKMQKNSTNYHK